MVEEHYPGEARIWLKYSPLEHGSLTYRIIAWNDSIEALVELIWPTEVISAKQAEAGYG